MTKFLGKLKFQFVFWEMHLNMGVFAAISSFKPSTVPTGVGNATTYPVTSGSTGCTQGFEAGESWWKLGSLKVKGLMKPWNHRILDRFLGRNSSLIKTDLIWLNIITRSFCSFQLGHEIIMKPQLDSSVVFLVLPVLTWNMPSGSLEDQPHLTPGKRLQSPQLRSWKTSKHFPYHHLPITDLLSMLDLQGVVYLNMIWSPAILFRIMWIWLFCLEQCGYFLNRV